MNKRIIKPLPTMSVGARYYMLHPKVNIGGSTLLSRPEAILSKKQYDLEVATYEWALKQVESNLDRIRAANTKLAPMAFSEDQKIRNMAERAKLDLQDAHFRRAWLKRGLAHIHRLWDATKVHVLAMEALKDTIKAAQSQAQAEAIIEKMKSLAKAANAAGAETTQVLIEQDSDAAKAGLMPPSKPVEPTDAGKVPSVTDLSPIQSAVDVLAERSSVQAYGADEDKPSFWEQYGLYIAGGCAAGLIYFNWRRTRAQG
jgi:hypothetical protein